MKKKRKNRGNWLYFITTLAYVLMFIWVFMLPGTKGLVIWDPGYAMYFYALGFVGVIPIILWLLDKRETNGHTGLSSKKKDESKDSPFFYVLMERKTGFEPATPCLASRCSTTEPHPHFTGASDGS